MTKINPLEQLIAIYGTKFADALKAGDLTKAIRMCADYQNPDTGDWLTFPDRIKAFAFRVSMEAFKVPEIRKSPAVTVHFTEEEFYMVMRDLEIGSRICFNHIHNDLEVNYMGVKLKRVKE